MLFVPTSELIENFNKIVEEIKLELTEFQNEGKQIFATSSFQTNSIPLLHIIGQMERKIPVCFLNTGFHFPETLAFRDKLEKEFNLKILNLSSAAPRSQQKDSLGRFFYTSEPDYCCHINKIAPLDPIMASHDIWINGIRKGQSAVRAQMKKIEPAPQNVLRYHPMLEWTTKMVHDYIRVFNLPRHPLEGKGYMSIGCQPCTHKISANDMLDNRTGRWKGMNKTECGLHTKLVSK
ncbi:MAG: phosphoadenylyl-sulfate reductase [Flammeovirgaceae bacterium]|nr:phosphoadenylyl-sulfate reductase [Flammeovirgaceae bacterium]